MAEWLASPNPPPILIMPLDDDIGMPNISILLVVNGDAGTDDVDGLGACGNGEPSVYYQPINKLINQSIYSPWSARVSAAVVAAEHRQH